MKRYSKRFLAFLMAFVLMISMVPHIGAAERTFDGTEKLYVDLGAVSYWLDAGAVQKAYFFNADGGQAWADLSPKEGTVYEMTVPAGTWTNLILVRMDPAGTSENPWDNTWNQTGDIPLDAEKNYITSFAKDSASATWDVYDGGETPDPDPELSDYYLTGGMNSWNTQDSRYQLSLGSNPGEYVLSNVALEENTEIKIVHPSDNTWYPAGENYKVTENGIYNLSFYPAGGQAGYVEGYFKLTKVGDYNPEPVEVTYYLTGTFADWKKVDTYQLTAGENSGEYVITGVYLPAGAGVKVVSSKDIWYPDGMDNEYVVRDAGTYDVSFYPAGNVADYYKGYFKLTQVGSGEPSEPQDHTGADDKVILHCWNWSYDVIRENLPAIKAAGYTAIQTSPAQVPKGYHAEGRDNEVSGNWWALYQPVSFCIAPTKEDSYLGGKAELQALCEAAHELDIEVVVDIVSNHVGNGWNDIHDAGGDPEQTVGEGGKLFWVTPSGEVANYGLDWLLEKDGTGYRYFRDFVKCTDNSTEGTVRGCIELPDLKTETPEVQAMVAGYLEELIDVGVDGFRFDAAKHIETPTDGACASDYWPTILGAAETHFKEVRGTEAELWSYGEILYQAAYTRNMSQYTPYLDVTDINYAGGLIYGFGEGKGASSIASLEIRDWNGKDKEPIPAQSAVLFAETHDMYSDSQYSTSKFTVQDVNKSWAVAAARADVSVLYFARPAGYADHAPYGTMGRMESEDWMDLEVVEANKFHTAFVGADEYVHADGNYVLVERWSDADCGLVIVNAAGTTSTVNVRASHLADGTYYDQITGEAFTVADGAVTGTMGSTGIVILRDAEPAACDHPAEQRYTKTVEATCTEDGSEAVYCSNCGRMVELIRIIPALGHVDADGDKHCDRCGEFLGLVTVYYVDTNMWVPANDNFNHILVYAWNDSGSNNTWPGVEMELVGRTKDNFGIWKTEMNPERYTSLLFNYNGRQTVDLPYVADLGTASYIIYTGEYEAAGRHFDGTERLYVNVAAVSFWTDGNALLPITLIQADGMPVDVYLTQQEGSVYSALIPAGNYTSLVLSRLDPNEPTTVWNRTGYIPILPQGNYIVSFTEGSSAAEWGFWPSGTWESIEATCGAALEDICGHTGYTITRYYNQEAKVCNLCGTLIEVQEVEPDMGANLFDDVRDPDSFYMTPVYWAVAMGITKGTGGNLFSPRMECSRSQVVTFLWRAAGSPKPETQISKFTDVQEGAFYYDAVLWAVENGITKGTSDTTFAPDLACDRAQVVTFLWRFMKEPEATLQTNPFTDVEAGAYYYDAVLWAAGEKITTGTSAVTFEPTRICDRSQIVTFIYRTLAK